jgi:hypothetical protein
VKPSLTTQASHAFGCRYSSGGRDGRYALKLQSLNRNSNERLVTMRLRAEYVTSAVYRVVNGGAAVDQILNIFDSGVEWWVICSVSFAIGYEIL